ncbi:MAG: nucleotidyltransferase family protein [Clostridium sp.]
MNKIEKQLIDLLNKAIHGERVDTAEIVDTDWEKLLYEAKEHHVETLVYSAINRKEAEKYIDSEKFKQWKKEVFYSGINQQNHIQKVGEILNKFNENNTPVIVLKGLVVREYFPMPQLRTMSDADVLVHKEDLGRVSSMMIGLGFTQTKNEDDHGAHIVFSKPGQPLIEVHWTLANKDFFKGDTSWEDGLWNDTISVQVGGVDTLSLGLEDLAVHLCIHMAVHLAYTGFGVRQLLDLVLLVEKKGEEIKWFSFFEKAKRCGIYKFALAILNVCNRLFDMELPIEMKKFNGVSNISNKYLELLIEDIFASGVHGNKDETRIFASEFAFDQCEGATKGNKSIVKKFFKLLFPPISLMSNKYSYAKKFIILAPIAWIHHLIMGLFNKDYKLSNKVKMATSTMTVANKRNQLLKELEL